MESNPVTSDQSKRDSLTRVPRRAALKAGAVTLSVLGVASPAAATRQDDDETTPTESDEVDEPEGFDVEVLAPYATFPDDVAMEFEVDYADDGEETTTLDDASTMVVVEATVEPGGTTGWHTHPGVVIVSVVAGELDVVFGDDCVTHNYAAGEAFVDTGNHVEVARNPSESDEAEVYATFLGVPEGEDLTTWVEPADC